MTDEEEQEENDLIHFYQDKEMKLEDKINELNKSVDKAVQTIQELQEKYEKQKEINKELVDENEKLKDKNAKLRKRIEEYNLCGNTVDKQTYNEAVNELAVLKAEFKKLQQHSINVQKICFDSCLK